MNQKQLSDRMGNIDDRLVQQAEQVPDYARRHRRNGWKRVAGMAAAVALLVCGGVMTADQVENSQWNYAANRYLFATQDCTYLLYYASDVQFPPDMEEEYRQLEAGIQDIRMIVDRLLAGKE
ncbi:MAG: hypothetical protein ACI3WR_04675 [Oscillospiraceae bacterium]